MRGVGQTTNMIDNLPTGRCMVVSSDPTLVRGLKNSTEEIRGKDFTKNVKFISISSLDDCNKLLGYSHPVFFDHFFFESVEEEVARKALQFSHTGSIVNNIGR